MFTVKMDALTTLDGFVDPWYKLRVHFDKDALVCIMALKNAFRANKTYTPEDLGVSYQLYAKKDGQVLPEKAYFEYDNYLGVEGIRMRLTQLYKDYATYDCFTFDWIERAWKMTRTPLETLPLSLGEEDEAIRGYIISRLKGGTDG